jgi:hypothetical protein
MSAHKFLHYAQMRFHFLKIKLNVAINPPPPKNFVNFLYYLNTAKLAETCCNEFFVFCTVHCGTVTQHKPKKYTIL